jgi:ubiquinone/menaquinone biosynthesis C-methylase UbiE
MSAPAPDGGFDRCAARYDELRPVDANWWQLFDRLVELGELRGARVLEIGCGTGRLAHALEERALARVWAVDASTEMVARAKDLGVNARAARAEALPFKRGWFDAAVTRMAVHLFDRPRAFAEIERILSPAGRFAIATRAPDELAQNWLREYFPSVPALDVARFPDEAALRGDVAAAGFGAVHVERVDQKASITRDRALEVIRAKAYSTLELLPPEEYERGLARAEAEQPELLEYRLDWLVVVARRAPPA